MTPHPFMSKELESNHSHPYSIKPNDSSFPAVSSSSSIKNSSSITSTFTDLNRQLVNLQNTFTEQKGKIEDLDDPLSVFDSYYQQLQTIQNLPEVAADATLLKSINSFLVPLLDGATQTFANDPRYRNDARYLKLWLAYARFCREAEEIFVFLGQQGIAQDLATFYEEYAGLLEKKAVITNSKELIFKANTIFQKGIDKRAQPIERLKKKYVEFENRSKARGHILPTATASTSTSIPITVTQQQRKAVEVRGYNSQLIQNGDLSFEEVRAQLWYSKPKIAKPSINEKYLLPTRSNDYSFQPVSMTSIQTLENVHAHAPHNRNTNTSGNPSGIGNELHVISSDEESDLPTVGLGVSINPDDLTHINVFKDNTADLREIAKLVKAKNQQQQQQQQHPLQIQQTAIKSISSPMKVDKITDWLLNDIVMESPQRKKVHIASSSITEEFNLSFLPRPEENENDKIKSNLKTAVANSEYKIKDDLQLQVAPTEPQDQPLLIDPFDIGFRIAQCEAVLSQIASVIPNLHLRLNESAGGKVKAFEKSLGRDGSGPNHTVSSLRMASGHFFMEKKLGEGGYGKVFLAVDLMANDNDNEESGGCEGEDASGNRAQDPDTVNQVAIKIETPASVWESYILFRIHSFLYPLPPVEASLSRHFPRLMSASIYSDVSFLVIDYFDQGSLLSALNIYRQQNLTIDEGIILFYALELLKMVGILHRAGILHTDIKLENLMIRSGGGNCNNKAKGVTAAASTADGWSHRGLVLIDYGRAIDLKLLKEEERSRFRIKEKHFNFNGSPRILEGKDISHEMDWYGVADCLHWLLFHKSLSSDKQHTTHFKRYWQVDIWEALFEDLLNPPDDLFIALDRMKRHVDVITNRLENWRKTPSLKSLLNRQEIMLYENLPKFK